MEIKKCKKKYEMKSSPAASISLRTASFSVADKFFKAEITMRETFSTTIILKLENSDKISFQNK